MNASTFEMQLEVRPGLVYDLNQKDAFLRWAEVAAVAAKSSAAMAHLSTKYFREKASETLFDAAEALKLTAQDLLRLGVIDEIVPEPLGGAHRQPKEAVTALGDRIGWALQQLVGADGGTLKARRREKFLDMGKKGLG